MDIEEIEKVQRRLSRDTKQAKSLRGSSHEQRLRKLNLSTLRYRRHRGNITELYKILWNCNKNYFRNSSLFWHKTAEQEGIL